MDFQHDLAEILKQQLIMGNIEIPDEWSDHDICLNYLEIKNRWFDSSVSYKVVYSKQLLEKIPTLSKEEQSALGDIVKCLEECISLKPYMSKLIQTTDMKKSDFLLKNWGIYHLHLEKLSVLKTNFKMPNLLFFQPMGRVIHFIDVKPHPKGATWFDRDLLEIIYSNWPWLLNFLNEVKPLQDIPDDKVHNFNKHAVSIIQFHGGALVPTNFGVATSGNSVKAVMECNRIFNELRKCEIRLKEQEAIIKKKIEEEVGVNATDLLEYNLMIEDGWFLACEKNSGMKIKLFNLM